MKRNKLLSTSALLFALCGLVSCNNSNSKIYKNIKYIDIAGAKSLFVSSKGESSITRESPKRGPTQKDDNVFYKMNDEGIIEQVEYKNEQGKTMKIDLYPQVISEVNSEYVFIDYNKEYNLNAKYNSQFLLNKKTNKCYEFPKGFCLEDGKFSASQESTWFVCPKEFFLVTDDNCFYSPAMKEDGVIKLFKIDLNDIENITIKQVSAPMDSFSYFDAMFSVDKYGNILYRAIDKNNLDVYRFLNKEGSIRNFEPYEYSWLGYDGLIYYKTSVYTSEQQGNETYNGESTAIKQISMNDQNEVVSSLYYNSAFAHRDNIYVGSRMETHLLYLDSLHKIFSLGGDGEYGLLCELYNDEHVYKTEQLMDLIPNFASLRYFASSDSEIYVSGLETNNNSFFGKIIINEDGSYSWVPINTNRIDVTRISPNNNGTATFSGVQLSSGKYVVGTVSQEGEISLSFTNLSNDVLSMVEIQVD